MATQGNAVGGAATPMAGESPEYEWDVFISYSHLDGDWVRGTLMPELKKAEGLKVCIDKEDFVVGESGQRSLQDGLEHKAPSAGKCEP